VKKHTFRLIKLGFEFLAFSFLGDKVENYILKAGWSTLTLQKQFAINHLALIAASATVGSGSVTPPKRAFNRKIKDFYCFFFKILYN
jgi:hypothetical protein